MNEEQKAIAEEIFYMFDQEHIAPVEALNASFALLQELIDAPEPEQPNQSDQHLEMVRDAERYRWLLANYAFGDGFVAIDSALNDGEAAVQLSPAIDAAIAAEKGGA